MELNNIYKIQNKPLKEILNEVDTIITNITTFKNKYSGYSYDIKITSNNNLWGAEIIIIKNEKQINNKILEERS